MLETLSQPEKIETNFLSSSTLASYSEIKEIRKSSLLMYGRILCICFVCVNSIHEPLRFKDYNF